MIAQSVIRNRTQPPCVSIQAFGKSFHIQADGRPLRINFSAIMKQCVSNNDEDDYGAQFNATSRCDETVHTRIQTCVRASRGIDRLDDPSVNAARCDTTSAIVRRYTPLTRSHIRESVLLHERRIRDSRYTRAYTSLHVVHVSCEEPKGAFSTYVKAYNFSAYFIFFDACARFL